MKTLKHENIVGPKGEEAGTIVIIRDIIRLD